jgi:hypothetical protein
MMVMPQVGANKGQPDIQKLQRNMIFRSDQVIRALSSLSIHNLLCQPQDHSDRKRYTPEKGLKTHLQMLNISRVPCE